MTAEAFYAVALAATARAYPPYSNLHVGAVLEAQDGTLIEGANVEFGSYGLTICAERTALVKAVSDGHRSFRRVGRGTLGRAPHLTVRYVPAIARGIRARHARGVPQPGRIVERPLRELLPDAFTFDD